MQFALRYANPGTRRYYERDLAALFEFAGVDHPRLVNESMVLAWCGQGRANNSVRDRLLRVCTFLRWCVRQGVADPALVEALMGRDNPLRQIPRLYGKVQGLRPPVAEPGGRLRGADRRLPGRYGRGPAGRGHHPLRPGRDARRRGDPPSDG